MSVGLLTPKEEEQHASVRCWDWRECFAIEQPLVLDLGCGNGVFLTTLAERSPNINVLGIEKKAYRVRQARRRVGVRTNACVVEGEVTDVLRQMPLASVAAAYLLFSDPWPKRRHTERRLVQRKFVELLASRLTCEGTFFFASDSAAYFRYAREIFLDVRGNVAEWMPPNDWPMTEFERRFAEEGLAFYRFRASF